MSKMNLSATVAIFFIAFEGALVTHANGAQYSPYYASIEKFGQHVCGGAIISSNVVLTTASCLYNAKNLNINIRVGSNQFETLGSTKAAQKLIIHKRYVTTRKDYDIALIVLDENLQFSNEVQPIDLAAASLNAPKQGTLGTLTGFGLGAAHFTSELRQEDVAITVPIACKNAYAPLFIYITDRMFCAELSSEHACKGDSGSLLVINNELIGIQAWEHKCGNSKFPGIYTNIANLRDWIKKSVNL